MSIEIYANGSASTWSMPFPVSMVYVNGVIQNPIKDYQYNGSTISFPIPPKLGDVIAVHGNDPNDPYTQLGPKRSNEILTEHLNDIILRQNNPSLEKAWQHYQTVKNLTA